MLRTLRLPDRSRVQSHRAIAQAYRCNRAAARSISRALGGVRGVRWTRTCSNGHWDEEECGSEFVFHSPYMCFAIAEISVRMQTCLKRVCDMCRPSLLVLDTMSRSRSRASTTWIHKGKASMLVARRFGTRNGKTPITSIYGCMSRLMFQHAA